MAQSVTYCGVAIWSLSRERRTWIARGVVDELHFALSPVVLGQGEAMFAGIDLPALGYRVTEHQATEHATHVVLGR
jgi:dihydrofolate reductase